MSLSSSPFESMYECKQKLAQQNNKIEMSIIIMTIITTTLGKTINCVSLTARNIIIHNWLIVWKKKKQPLYYVAIWKESKIIRACTQLSGWNISLPSYNLYQIYNIVIFCFIVGNSCACWNIVSVCLKWQMDRSSFWPRAPTLPSPQCQGVPSSGDSRS